MAKFQRFLGREPTTADLTDAAAAELLEWMAAPPQSYSPRTINNCRAYIVSLWRFANRKGFVRVGPDVAKYPEPDEQPVAFTLEELGRLLAAADAAGVFWGALVRAIWSTGERIGAVLQWRRDWVDLQTGLVAVPGRIRKGGRRHSYGLQAPALAAVGELLASHRNELVFYRCCSLQTLYYRFGAILRAAGLPSGREWKFHCIRKSFASYLAKEHGEAVAQDGLGHVSRTSTRRYLAPRIVGAARMDDRLPPL